MLIKARDFFTMKLEYLFLDKNKKDEITHFQYIPDSKSKTIASLNLTKKIKEFEGSDKWTLQFTAKGRNEFTAKHLSAINEEIAKFSPIVLTNESAEYFNKSIYPLANEFERKLRKFLYLKCSLLSNDIKETVLAGKIKTIIDKIDTLDMGKIYELLFTDDSVFKTFRDKVQSRISSKAYYQKVLSEIPERTIWDTIMHENKNDYIKNHFLDIIDYRNDAMHAHNITYADCLKHKNTFEKAISFLQKEIDKVESFPLSGEIAETTVNSIMESIDSLVDSPSESEFQKMLYYEKMKELLYPDDYIKQLVKKVSDAANENSKNNSLDSVETKKEGNEYEKYPL